MFPLQRRLEKLSLTRLIGGHDVAGTVDGAGTNYYLFLDRIRQQPRIDNRFVDPVGVFGNPFVILFRLDFVTLI